MMVKAGKNRDIWRGNISDMDKAVDRAKPPSQLLLTLELRGIWELQAFFATYPLLQRAARRRTPGARVARPCRGDISTRPLRTYLKALGLGNLQKLLRSK